MPDYSEIPFEEIPDDLDNLSIDDETMEELGIGAPNKRKLFNKKSNKLQEAKNSKPKIKPVEVNVQEEIDKANQLMAEYEVLPEGITKPEQDKSKAYIIEKDE